MTTVATNITMSFCFPDALFACVPGAWQGALPDHIKLLFLWENSEIVVKRRTEVVRYIT